MTTGNGLGTELRGCLALGNLLAVEVRFLEESSMSENEEKKSFWSDLRDGCGAVRELAVVGALVLLILAPRTIHTILARAGLTSVAGFEFDVVAIEEANQQTHDAALQMAAVKEQLAKVESQVEQYAVQNRTPQIQALARSLKGLEQQLGTAQGNLSRAANSVRNSVPEQFRIQLTQPEKLVREAMKEPKPSVNR